MKIISATFVCILAGHVFWTIGHILRKELKINEDNKLLELLINISLGSALFLIVLNLAGTISKSFIVGILTSLLLTFGIIGWRLKEYSHTIIQIKDYLLNNKIIEIIKQNTNQYFWMIIVGLNVIYGLSFFTKLREGDNHISNVNQLLNDIYPIKYELFPDISQRTHYGVDILAGIISRFSGFHPEISFDILSLIFLNLSFLTFYAITIKLLNTNKINKYIVPFAALLAWGPVTQLFIKNSGELPPRKLPELVSYLSTTKLADAAIWSGSTINWFSEISTEVGIFYLIVALYLTYRFINEDTNPRFAVMLGVFLSSFVIINFINFVIILAGILILFLLFYTPYNPMDSKKEIEFLKNIGRVFGIALVLGFIHGNSLRFDNSLIPFHELYSFGKTNMDNRWGPIQSNTVLIFAYIFGFYQAFKQKHKWVCFLIPFFAACFVIPYVISIPDTGSGKVIMSGNLVGAFALPFTIDFLFKKTRLNEKYQSYFYIATLTVISFCTIMYFAFGDKTNSLCKIDNNSVKFSGFQKIIPVQRIEGDEQIFIEYIKSKNVKNKTILTEPQYSEIFAKNTALHPIQPTQNINTNMPVKKEILEKFKASYDSAVSLDKKTLLLKNIEWLYLTPKMFRYEMPPQVRNILLNSYFNNGIKLALSNRKFNDIEALKELYEIKPALISNISKNNIKDLIADLNNGNNYPTYIKEVALCPYFGIYNAMSNDFDGDGISDIAFYDSQNKKWIIVHTKDQKEEQIDLTEIVLQNQKEDLFIPVPADYDGDSKTDIALFNRNDATWHIIKSSTGEKHTGQRWGGDNGEIPLPADIDGDSKADFSAFGAVRNNWPSLVSTTGSYFDNAFSSRPLSDITIYSDVDGDKKADYVIYRPNNSSFYIHLSSRNYNRSNPLQIIIGGMSARIAPEDYDGDGKVDLATWIPEDGTWEIAYAKDFLLTKTDGLEQKSFTKTTMLTLGSPGDIPMPADYNGDGKAEIAVLHNDNYILEIVNADTSSRKIDLSKYKNLTPASFIGI